MDYGYTFEEYHEDLSLKQNVKMHSVEEHYFFTTCSLNFVF